MADPLETTQLALPYIAAAQAQKHVTHNEALRMLDGIVQLAVEASAATAPPGAPAAGARYLLGTSPTGVWSGQGGKLAFYADGAWWFATPRTGWLAYDRGTDQLLVLKASGWTPV